MVWCGVVWCGVVWCGAVRCGVVWCGVVWCGAVRCGAVRCGAVRCGAVRCGAVRCGAVWCGVVWCGVVWCGVVWCGVVWCGTENTHAATVSNGCPDVHVRCDTDACCSDAHSFHQDTALNVSIHSALGDAWSCMRDRTNGYKHYQTALAQAASLDGTQTALLHYKCGRLWSQTQSLPDEEVCAFPGGTEVHERAHLPPFVIDQVIRLVFSVAIPPKNAHQREDVGSLSFIGWNGVEGSSPLGAHCADTVRAIPHHRLAVLW